GPPRGFPTTSSSARGELGASASCGREPGTGLGPALLDQPDHAGRGLLDRELGNLDHRAAKPPVDRLRRLELVVDLDELCVAAVVRAQTTYPLLPDLGQPARFDREPDDLEGIDLEQHRRRLDSLHDRDVRRLVAEVAEVDREW